LETRYESWIANERALGKKKERLSALEYQLRILDQPWPPSPPPRRFNPKEPGPIPDSIDDAVVQELRRQIAQLRKEIDELQGVINRQKAAIAQAEGKVDQIEAKLREVEGQLIEPERQYRLKCGDLEPQLGVWR
jgi:DNA repair exonuclease SbcCD ATPase subunit